MITVRLFEHPLAPVAPRVFRAPSLAEWMLSHFGARLSVGLQIFAGEPAAERAVPLTPEAILAAAGPDFTVLQAPGVDPTSAVAAQAFLGFFLTVASAMTAPDPDMPANVNRTQMSPNNGLSARENQVRLLQRIEDIYGTVLSIPSLIAATYTKFINNIEVEFSYMCVGRGYHDISDIRDGETPLAAIRGAGARVYAPFTSPNSGSPQLAVGESISDPILTVRRAVEVDGETLFAANQLQVEANAPYLLAKPGGARTIPSVLLPGSFYRIPASTKNQIIQLQKKPAFGSIAEIGQTVTVTGVPDTETVTRTGSVAVDGPAHKYTNGDGLFAGALPGDQVVISGFPDPENNGTFTVASNSGGELVVTSGSQISTFATVGITLDFTFYRSGYNGTFTITGIQEEQALELTAGDWVADRLFETDSPVTVVVNNGLTDWTDWVTLPAADRDRVWTNFRCLSGLYGELEGSKVQATVTYEIQVERLTSLGVPTGEVETYSSGMSGASSDIKSETVEHMTGWTGPARVRVRRTSPYLFDFAGTLQDEVKWTHLYAVSPVDLPHFGNLTTIQTVTQATVNATSLRSRQLNCIATRRIPTWTGSGFSGAFDAEGRHVSGTITGTSYLRDVLAAVALDPVIGRRSAAELDMAQISATAAAVADMHPDAASFSYTFDSDQLSFEETVNIIAEACFCRAYRQSGRIRLAFETTQDAAVATLTPRNKRPGDVETITRTFANDADYDGIEFSYQDPDTRQAETIRLPMDGSYTQLRRIERPGIRSFAQAWLHANREMNKLRYQRLTIETEITADARALVPLSRVDIVDNTAFKAYAGEVVGQSGLTLTLSEPVEFEVGESHSVLLARRNGSVQAITVTAGAKPTQIVLATAPDEALVTDPTPEDGIRTRYSFASDSARAAQAWILMPEIAPSEDGYWKLSGIAYRPEYYQADIEPIPEKETVIS